MLCVEVLIFGPAAILPLWQCLQPHQTTIAVRLVITKNTTLQHPNIEGTTAASDHTVLCSAHKLFSIFLFFYIIYHRLRDLEDTVKD